MNPGDELKQTLTQWWEYMAVRAACQLDLFDLIQDGFTTTVSIAERIPAKQEMVKMLLDSLVVTGYLRNNEGQTTLTPKGTLLTKGHPESLKEAAILWGGEHINAWQGLAETIKTGIPAFETGYGQGYFDYLSQHPKKLSNYHSAMDEYAKEDYADLGHLYDFSEVKVLMDVGGGKGTLLKSLQLVYPQLDLILFDRPEVIATAGDFNGIQQIGGDFFEIIPTGADGIILARVLHDWPDEQASAILAHCYSSLPANGKLFIIENLPELLEDGASLLSLNMAVICDSHERTQPDYKDLLEKAGFSYRSEIKINALQWMIIAQK